MIVVPPARGRKRRAKWPRRFATRRDFAAELRALAEELRLLGAEFAPLEARRDGLRSRLNELAAIGEGQFGPGVPDTSWRAYHAAGMAENAEHIAEWVEKATVVLRVVDGGGKGRAPDVDLLES